MFSSTSTNSQNNPSGKQICLYCGLVFIGAVDRCPADGDKLVAAMVHPEEAKLVPEYHLEREVGRGGTSTVYRAVRLKDRQVFAIKIMHPWMATDERAIARFCKEVELTARLDSAHTMKAVGYSVLADGRPYMIMDYIEGRTLTALLRSERQLQPERALPLFIQMAWGLAHCHALGIVHGDIKPGNILVHADGERVVIADFGIAKHLDEPSLLAAGETVGSPTYMSPEQCLGRDFDQRTDIYSMGCLMYEVLTGRPVFFSEDPVSLMKMHVYTQPSPLRLAAAAAPTTQANVALEQLVLTALAKNPDMRYSDISRLQIDLQKSLSAYAASDKLAA